MLPSLTPAPRLLAIEDDPIAALDALLEDRGHELSQADLIPPLSPTQD